MAYHDLRICQLQCLRTILADGIAWRKACKVLKGAEEFANLVRDMVLNEHGMDGDDARDCVLSDVAFGETRPIVSGQYISDKEVEERVKFGEEVAKCERNFDKLRALLSWSEKKGVADTKVSENTCYAQNYRRRTQTVDSFFVANSLSVSYDCIQNTAKT
ncbi:hypothetical protein HDV00_007642 [Rhizophlyctis rosea]|nr:hypothetical protein HDV00_007642 [Rhizophlyctis rosea]